MIQRKETFLFKQYSKRKKIAHFKTWHDKKSFCKEDKNYFHLGKKWQRKDKNAQNSACEGEATHKRDPGADLSRPLTPQTQLIG